MFILDRPRPDQYKTAERIASQVIAPSHQVGPPAALEAIGGDGELRCMLVTTLEEAE